MKHIKAILALGFAVAILPFLGFPNSWDTVIFIVLGLSIVALSVRIMMLATAAEEAAEPESYQQNTVPAEETLADEYNA